MSVGSTYYPSVGDALAANARFARAPVRDLGLLESALARPQASAYGQDAYPDLWSKAAALLHSVIRNHPFIDGNKRTGFALWVMLLAENGEDLARFDEDVAFELVVGVASGKYDDVEPIAAALRAAFNASAA